ncbi:MAG: hypothetical protein E2P02_18530 [Acidobacteria bacterium]|nr:MAG: hypothetical protein E2P02_18530 [Acidobacteriota bacterium]
MRTYRRELKQRLKHPLADRLVPILLRPTGRSSAGYPFLRRDAWENFRDTIPHLFGMGREVLRAIQEVEQTLEQLDVPAADRESLSDACKVTRQVVLTATITAPCDLWLLRHVLGFFGELGLLERLLTGEPLYPESCTVRFEGRKRRLLPRELDIDLHFLLSRGIIEQYDNGFRIAGHPRVREVLGAIRALRTPPGGVTRLWRDLFAGGELAASELEVLLDLAQSAVRRIDPSQNHWIATVEEVELGYRLVPLVLGLRAENLTSVLTLDCVVKPSDWSATHPATAAGALEILTAAGWMERLGEDYRVNAMGARGFERGPGPFGIIETYHPYMSRGREILLGSRREIWVRRAENVGASQDANRGTFLRANDVLDRFCEETGFRYEVFIEHAIGRGEATRQRHERPGSGSIRYVGADLEDAAIDAALEEQRRGVLPSNMLLVRRADIGKPESLLEALAREGIEPHGAVMLVGNGFHEIRNQTDAGLVAVFRGYHQAGIVLLFTEENALSVDDLRATAWNTYHSGFRYVHEKSGQGLRPAVRRPDASRLGHPLVAPWSECAREAGYVRADAYCSRTRTIYPYPPRSGYNPAISMNHFFVPASIARELGIG